MIVSFASICNFVRTIEKCMIFRQIDMTAMLFRKSITKVMEQLKNMIHMAAKVRCDTVNEEVKAGYDTVFSLGNLYQSGISLLSKGNSG